MMNEVNQYALTGGWSYCTKEDQQKKMQEKTKKIIDFCRMCGATETPEWRSGPQGRRTLCNGCGLHARRVEKKRVQKVEADRKALYKKIRMAQKAAFQCLTCGATETSIWFFSKTKRLPLCHECGVKEIKPAMKQTENCDVSLRSDDRISIHNLLNDEDNP